MKAKRKTRRSTTSRPGRTGLSSPVRCYSTLVRTVLTIQIAQAMRNEPDHADLKAYLVWAGAMEGLQRALTVVERVEHTAAEWTGTQLENESVRLAQGALEELTIEPAPVPPIPADAS